MLCTEIHKDFTSSGPVVRVHSIDEQSVETEKVGRPAKCKVKPANALPVVKSPIVEANKDFLQIL